VTAPHVDPYREIDAQPDPVRVIESLEQRGRTPAQARMRRRFLRFIPVRAGAAVLEVGCGTGIIVRDLAGMVGPRGRVVGVDVSRAAVESARRFGRSHPAARRMSFRVADGGQLPFRAGAFDVTLAVTVMLHVADPLAVVREMARVTRPGGLVALQDQDFGAVVLEHPDRVLTARILDGVVHRLYAEPYSGRRLPALLRAAGLGDVRLLADMYQDTMLTAYTQTFLGRRAENAVRFGIVSEKEAQRWLDGVSEQFARGAFVFTMNYYGAVATKPVSGSSAARARRRR
jgi:ubiquinone/menaquinone biosynthesis C-methylase UbiE